MLGATRLTLLGLVLGVKPGFPTLPSRNSYRALAAPDMEAHRTRTALGLGSFWLVRSGFLRAVRLSEKACLTLVSLFPVVKPGF